MSDIVNKLWGFCHTLRHDGIDYGDYIEQLTYLLFLKMADEQSKPPYADPDKRRDAASTIPKGYDYSGRNAGRCKNLQT